MEELLHKAIERGDETQVRQLITKGAAMDKLMGLRGTALCAAISDRQTTIALYLIDSGCDVNGEDYDREPPLLLAMRKECFTIVQKLIDNPKCNLNKADPLTKLTPLCFAAKTGQLQVVQWLLKTRCSLTGKDGEGNSALHLAISNSQYEVIELLVRNNCSLVALNDAGFAPVHTTARRGDPLNLIRLLSKYVKLEDKFPSQFKMLKLSDANRKNVLKIINSFTKFERRTPLLIAAREGHSNLLKLLLMCGADPNLSDLYEQRGEETPDSFLPTPLLQLCLSYKQGLVDLDIITWLLDAGSRTDIPALIDMRPSNFIATPLCFAAIFNLDDLVRLLVQYDADVNSVSNQSRSTAMFEAMMNNSEQVIWYFLKECNLDYKKSSGVFGRNYFHASVFLPPEHIDDILDCLVSKGCPINWTDSSLQTPLSLAVEKQNVPCVRKLLSLGADVSICKSNGNSPLHVCADVGSVRISKMLLVHGADVNSKNDKNESPLDICFEYIVNDEHKQIAILLLQNGCRSSLKTTNELEAELADDNDDEDNNSGSSCSSSCSSDSDEDLLIVLKDLLKIGINKTPSLFMFCVITIRNHFNQNRLSFTGITELPLPKAIIDHILLN